MAWNEEQARIELFHKFPNLTPQLREKKLQEMRVKAQGGLSNDDYVNTIKNGGYVMTDDMLRRAGDYNYGITQGQKEFYDDPDMKNLRARREDLAKGYSGEELGALRETARGEIAGQRSNYLKSLSSNLARGGAGGARAAAVRTAADRGFQANAADAERKMTLDSANMVRQGTNDLQDFIFRQKYGKVGLGVGNAQLGSADYGAEQARKANSGGDKGMCFITTAACEFYGLPDDCDELQTLRKFRDEVMLKTEGWASDVAEYYALAKELTPKLAAIKDPAFWDNVFDFIKTSVAYVKAGENSEAHSTYKDLITFVKGA